MRVFFTLILETKFGVKKLFGLECLDELDTVENVMRMV